MSRLAKWWRIALALACAVGVAMAADGDGSRVRVTYIANEGVLLSGPEGAVLIDALFRDGVDGYAVIAPEQRSRLEQARGEYAAVELVLATHDHADHYEASAVAAHLAANDQALFVSTPQSVDRLRVLDGFAAIEPRVRAVHPEEGERVALSHGGVEIEVLNLHHGRNRPIENLGFIVTLGGRRFLHVGDTVATLDDFRINGLAADEIDVALIPYWHLGSDNGRRAVEEGIAPGVVIPIHVPVGGAPLAGSGGSRARLLDRLDALGPDVLVLREPGDSLRF